MAGVSALARRGDERGVRLVAARRPGAGGRRRLAVRDVARDELRHALRLVLLDVPDRVEQRPDRLPATIVEQQVVALRDHERDRRDGDRAGDRLLDLTPERRRVHERLGGAQPLQQRDVAGDVERVPRPMRSRRPSRTSSSCARWKPSIGTSTARPSSARQRLAATVDLPAPGGPQIPRSRPPVHRPPACAPAPSARRTSAAGASRQQPHDFGGAAQDSVSPAPPWP